MKDLVEKFIVLQIQTAPSRLQHASAGCFLAAMILPSAPSGICAHAQHATLHFKSSESRRDCRAKYEIVTKRPIYSYAKWYSFYLIKSIAIVLLHVMPHICLKMHQYVAIPDYRSLFTQTSLVNGYPSFYPRIALVAPSPGWTFVK